MDELDLNFGISAHISWYTYTIAMRIRQVRILLNSLDTAKCI